MTAGTHLPSLGTYLLFGKVTIVRAIPEGWVRWHVHCACRWDVTQASAASGLGGVWSSGPWGEERGTLMLCGCRPGADAPTATPRGSRNRVHSLSGPHTDPWLPPSSSSHSPRRSSLIGDVRASSCLKTPWFTAPILQMKRTEAQSGCDLLESLGELGP